jgi:hypothetical protein
MVNGKAIPPFIQGKWSVLPVELLSEYEKCLRIREERTKQGLPVPSY